MVEPFARDAPGNSPQDAGADRNALDRSAPSPETLATWDREHVWHAFTQMAEYEPLLIERARGCTLYDNAGQAYIDGVSSLWCNVHGHAHPHINAAIREQLERVAHTTLLGASNS